MKASTPHCQNSDCSGSAINAANALRQAPQFSPLGSLFANTSQLFANDANVGIIVSNLLAGIVFVDWLAIAPVASHWLGLIWLILFGLTKLLQKFVPAT